jgi:hypothetical protein
MLLHLGAGLVHTNVPSTTPPYDQNKLGFAANFPNPNLFPYMAFGPDASKGGFNPAGGFLGQTFNTKYTKEIKPTFNISLTMVKGNHTIKAGGELIVDGLPVAAYSRANGAFTFGPQQSGNPWENSRGLNASTGFGYASFFLGRNGGLVDGVAVNAKLGDHALSGYLQDSWKVTRKLTLDYGLRYDYQTLYKEQYGRLGSAAPNVPNPIAGNRPGTTIYEATCNCSFNHNYPWAFGPRLGAAYQIDPKTVFRAGFGVAYGTAPANPPTNSLGDVYSLNAPGYGEPADILADGNPFAPGNKFGNPAIYWPNFTPRFPVESSSGVRQPYAPAVYVDRNSGRPPRILQWSIGFQREITRNLVVEAAYVGNRGVWWTAPVLSTESYNALTPDILKIYGLDTNIKADRDLLTTPISSPAVVARFPFLANPNNVYPGFPSTSSLNQALRPHPQWTTLSPYVGPPLGDTWYDSLQAKVTKRLSHGLNVDSAFTWGKELALGANSVTTYLTPAPALNSDPFNRGINKQLSPFGRPFQLVVSFNYITPKIAGDGTGMKVVSWLARDWTIGGLLRYQSGQLIRTPASNNGYFNQILYNAFGNFGGGNTFFNRVQGQNPLLFDPNCHCFDPTTQLVLNKDAWVDAAPGQFGTSAPYYNNIRWQRQPAESFRFGLNFRIREGIKLNLRAEWQNIFNRLFLSSPAPVNVTGFNVASPNPAAVTVRNSSGALTAGYGFVNTFNGAGTQPRQGQIVARFSF